MTECYSIASSSKGNSTFIGTESGGILIDVGVGPRVLETSLLAAGHKLDEISAIFITHEHIDHIKGLAQLTAKLNVPVYGSVGTLEALLDKNAVDEQTELREICHNTVTFGDLAVDCFPTSHDCAQSLGFRVTSSTGESAAVCTDLGFISVDVAAALTGCDFVLLESNYEKEMLENGLYPYHLKRRIAGDRGHLSNLEASREVARLALSGTKQFLLGHLSEKNNLPQLALAESANALTEAGVKVGEDVSLEVAPPRGFGKVIRVGEVASIAAH